MTATHPVWRAATWLGFVVVALVVAWVAIEQGKRLNLSATAGGQYPYLAYAERIAVEGAWNHVGERNRMPLGPLLLAAGYSDDPVRFHANARRVAVGMALLATAIVAVTAAVGLSRGAALVFTAWTALTIFALGASFVQAEIVFYALLLATWLAMCRTLARPGVAWGIASGALLALCYLTKASALPLGAAFLATSAAGAVLERLRRGEGEVERPRAQTGFVGAAASAVAAFVIITGPYLWTNVTRFGAVFYNVNSTYFMWCESWAEAKAFSDRYDAERQPPLDAAGDAPSPGRYLRERGVGHALRRLAFGLRTLAVLTWEQPATKYVLFASVVGMYALWRRRAAGGPPIVPGLCLAFSVVALTAYLASYAWYAQVAFGERFVVSLLPIVMFGLMWIADSRARGSGGLSSRESRWVGATLAVIAAGLALDVPLRVVPKALRPDGTFVRFYYNESRERELAGDVAEADRGYAGVLQLDPDFAPAQLGRGMIALRCGRRDDAVEHLGSAARIDPGSADIRNSLGSALLQSGRTREAVEQLEEAARLSPTSAVVLSNLGAAYVGLGEYARASGVVDRLRTVDAARAAQLAEYVHIERERASEAK